MAQKTCPIAPRVVRFDDAVGFVRDDDAAPAVIGHYVVPHLGLSKISSY